MLRRCLQILGLLLLACTPALADDFDALFASAPVTDEPRLSGELGLLFYETFFADVVHDSTPENPFDNVIRVLPHVKLERDDWRAKVSLLATHRFILGKGLQSKAEVEPWEMYVEWSHKRWELRVGNLITRWGRGAISLLDLPNPVDLTHGLSSVDEVVRRPLPQLRFTWFADNYTLGLVYNPFYREDKLAPFQSDWSLVRFNAAGGLESLPVIQQTLQQQVYPGTRSFPADDFLHGELGVRLNGSWPGWDWGLYGYTGWDRIALPHFSEEFLRYLKQTDQSAEQILDGLQVQEIVYFNPLYDLRPERNYYAAGDLSTTWQGYTWRLEGLVQSGTTVYREDLKLLRPPSFSTLIGMDSFGTGSFVFSLNLFMQAIFTREPLFQLDPFNIGLVGAMRWEPEGAPLLVEFRGGGLANDGSLWLMPSVGWPIAPGQLLSAGVEIIEGQRGRLAGNFSHNDAWFLRYRYQYLQ